MGADAPSVSVLVSKRSQIWDRRKMMGIEIQKTLFGGRNTENLIESACFYLKISRYHVLCLNYSQVHMFCDGDCLKLVTESMHSRFS